MKENVDYNNEIKEKFIQSVNTRKLPNLANHEIEDSMNVLQHRDNVEEEGFDAGFFVARRRKSGVESRRGFRPQGRLGETDER